MTKRDRGNVIIVTLYLEPEQNEFIMDLAKCERRSKTKQIEKMLRDWEKTWSKEHGPKAKATMRAFVLDMEMRAKAFVQKEKEA